MASETPPLVVSETSALAANDEHMFVATVSPAMRTVERTVHDIASTDMPVLIIGESGTGKGALAYRIHHLSHRRNDSFLRINCSALEPAAFANGMQKPGNGSNGHSGIGPGTIFFDEIGELDPACQLKMLDMLSDETIPALSPRVIACTRHDLQTAVRARRFREDLYYRICGVCLRLPPLRQRKDDIAALVDFFMSKYAIAFGRPKPEVSELGMRRLMNHGWPGNIRELEHSIQKLVVLGDEEVAFSELKAARKEPRPVSGEYVSLKQAAREASRLAERELILKALTRTRWNRKQAAQQLQISYKALLYKLKQAGLDSLGE